LKSGFNKRIFPYLFSLILMLLFVGTLYQGKVSIQQDFIEHEHKLSEVYAQQKSDQLALYLSGLQKSVVIFTEQYKHRFEKQQNPLLENLVHREIQEAMRANFKEYYAFDIIHNEAELDADNIDIGGGCREDLRKQLHNPYSEDFIRVHRGPAISHFDIVVPWQTEGHNGLFFVSFSLEKIASFIKQKNSEGHSSYVLMNDNSNMIELSNSTVSYQLSETFLADEKVELIRDEATFYVEGTQWVVVDLLCPEYVNNYLAESNNIFYGILAVFALMYFAFVWVNYRSDQGQIEIERLQNIERVSLEQKVKERTEALEDALEKAKSADIAKSQFINTISHELRTPMNGVLGMSNLLEKTNLDDTQKQYVEIVQSTGNSLLKQINDILEFSKLELGKREPKYTPVNVVEFVEDTTALTHHKFESEHLSLVHDFEQLENPVGMLDPFLIRQVLLNLVGNALKFTEAGTIKVKVETLTQDSLRFSVSDTGIGISKDRQTLIFESFRQEEDGYDRQYGGAGIGLSISEKIVNLLGGKIGLSSEKGHGSTFCFEVPFRPVIAKSEASIKHDQKVPMKNKTNLVGKKVLLVEDNVMNQQVAVAFLSKLGIQVDIANDGIEGIQMYKISTYDLVFMDLMMPNMDGFEATVEIRRYEHENELFTPISALTANTTEEDRQKCEEVGMNDFLGKPISFERLIHVLQKHVSDDDSPSRT